MRLRSLALLCPLLALPALSSAFPTTIVYTDDPNAGFNDPVLGPQRRAAFEYAVSVWASRLGGTKMVTIEANFEPMGGTAFGAPLAFAGPTEAFRDFAGAPLASTFYPVSLVRQLFPGDIPVEPDISATFNSDVDGPVVLGAVGFYYGLDETPTGSDISFVRTTLHELGHGLGFLSFLETDEDGDPTTGAFLAGFPSAYDRFLNVGPTPGGTAFSAGTDGDRLTNSTGNSLYWNGPIALAGNGDNPLRVYAPATWEAGSSLSHFQEGATTATGSEELMEPILNTDLLRVGLTDDVFADMGYTLLGPTNLPSAGYGGAQPSSGNEGAGAHTFTVNLSAVQTQTVTVKIATSGTATSGTDYTLSTDTLTFAPGVTTQTFDLTPLADAVSEAAETVVLRLSGIIGAEFGGAGSSTFTINNVVSQVEDWSLVED